MVLHLWILYYFWDYTLEAEDGKRKNFEIYSNITPASLGIVTASVTRNKRLQKKKFINENLSNHRKAIKVASHP